MADDKAIERKWTLEFLLGYGWTVRGPNIESHSEIEVMPVADHLVALGEEEAARQDHERYAAEYLVGRERARQERDDAERGTASVLMRAEAAERALGEAEKERDLAIAHDRQPYPTAEAYEKVCAARTKWQERAESLREGAEAAESSLQGLRSDIATVRGHLEGYADGLELIARNDLTLDLLTFAADLREDAEKLKQSGGEGES